MPPPHPLRPHAPVRNSPLPRVPFAQAPSFCAGGMKMGTFWRTIMHELAEPLRLHLRARDFKPRERCCGASKPHPPPPPFRSRSARRPTPAPSAFSSQLTTIWIHLPQVTTFSYGSDGPDEGQPVDLAMQMPPPPSDLARAQKQRPLILRARRAALCSAGSFDHIFGGFQGRLGDSRACYGV